MTLSDACAAYRLSTKWLLAPSNRVGHQWIERVVRNGHSLVNLRPTTLSRLAFEVAGSDLAKQRLTLASRDALELAIQSAWDELPPDGYLRRLERTDELSNAALDSILSVRMVGVDGAGMDASNMENPAKARDIAFLIQAYTRFLVANSLIDTAELLNKAVSRLRDDPLAVASGTLFLIPAEFPARGVERAFLSALPAAQCMEIEHPLETSSAGVSDIRLLVSLGHSSAAPKPSKDDSVRFFRATGETNEVREVLRRCLAEGVHLDNVEILHSNTETYLPLIWSTVRRFGSCIHPDGIPVTFAEGIPTTFSRPGRAMTAWLEWINEGFPQRLLAGMISEGLIECGDDEIGFGYLARLLRPLAIGPGSGRYLPKIDEQIRANQHLASKRRDDGDQADAATARERELKGLKHLRKLIVGLLKLSRVVSAGSGASILNAAETFLKKWARSVNELDRYAAEALCEQLQDRTYWTKRLDLHPSAKWILRLPAQTRVLGSGPRPGHLHVAHLGSGGQSGRGHTFVIGLDDRRFPGASLQDPILLDNERKRIHPEMPTSAERLQQKLTDVARSLSRLTGRVTFSWPCQDLADDRETFPSSLVLSAYRLISGQAETDLETLNDAVGLPASFAPTASAKALDETERWLWWLSHDDSTQGTSQMAAIEARFPHLARGNRADHERSTQFGSFNGLVPLAGQALNPFQDEGPVLSASALETAGRCPRAFFFRSALGLYPSEEMDVDENQWLDPAQFGQLLHDAFRRFMEVLTTEGKRPVFERDHTVLADILADRVKNWRDDRPPPNETAFRTQCWQLVRTSRIFLQAEEEFCQTSEPRYFEVALGLDRVGKGNALDSDVPVQIKLSGDRSIRTRGQIDRVDLVGRNRFSVWDYKTGSGYGYDQADPFGQGRRVQNVLYLRMIETALRERVDPKSLVDCFGYFFPGIRAHGLRIQWDAQTLESGMNIVERLCAMIAEGAFPATNEKNDCKFCDYGNICRDFHRVAAESEDLLSRIDLPELNHFRELRRG